MDGIEQGMVQFGCLQVLYTTVHTNEYTHNPGHTHVDRGDYMSGTPELEWQREYRRSSGLSTHGVHPIASG